MRIAIVDDSETFTVYLQSLLRGAGHDDLVFYDTAEKLLAALAGDGRPLPDLILMDCIMPGLGGLCCTRRIKADARLADIPVIMITVSDEEANLAEAFAAGAMDYIRKPLRRSELLARVDSALRLKQADDARKDHERRLRDEKDRMAAILEYSHDGIAVAGQDGRFGFVSPGMERIFGLPADSYTTVDRWLDIAFPDPGVRADLAELMTARPAPGHVWRRLAPHVAKDGQSRVCLIHLSTMPTGDLILNIQDVTLFEKQKEDLQKKHSRHQKDLEAAAEIQQSLLPRRFTMSPAIRFAWEFLPCESIGGDIFNVFPLGPDHVGLYMLDVSGHGVASSLVALSVYNFMHYQRATLVDRSAGRITVVPPEVVLTRLDAEFPFENFSKFFTMFYMTLDLGTGRVRYSNAGHPPPYRLTPDGDIATLPERGTIIGLSGFLPFPAGEFSMAPGERLIVTSDGLADTVGPDGAFFGEDRIRSVLTREAKKPLEATLAAVRRAARDFCGDTPPRDDLSLLGLEFVRPRA
ncbi:SpoIIE family protein phosphatase [Desulfovibrio sp. JY]|nr:SpoIIE family protein phosphatase [Desulfovibrio sp. JY]